MEEIVRFSECQAPHCAFFPLLFSYGRRNEVVDNFQELEKLRGHFDDIQVPTDVFRYSLSLCV